MKMRKIMAAALALVMCAGAALVPDVSAAAESYPGAHTLVLSSEKDGNGGYTHSALLDGKELEEFDYVWHADPSEVHDEVKNAPAEYYTGEKPETDAAAYIAHDIYYFPELPESGFQKVRYDDDQEWAYYYTDGKNDEYIFATLPVRNNSLPTDMMHSAGEAYENAVLHITEPGTYIVSGTWHGQLWIDLGDTDDTFADESAKVTLVLSGVSVECTAAPALVFYSVYECDNGWEERTEHSYVVDTSNTGANVILADGTVNSFTGANVYRMLKTKYKDGATGGSVQLQKKQRKLDGAFYSCVSMNIDGEAKGDGILNIVASNEGLDTELHLTINGGNVNVRSQDDGMNVNEDDVSVFTMNGGTLHILAGLGAEGDGIDSNGYIAVNGGTVISMAKPMSDSGLDSSRGTYILGGTVVALGSTMDWAEADETGRQGEQAAMNLQFAAAQSADEAIIVTDTSGKVVFAYDPDKDEAAGNSARSYQGAIISAPGIVVAGVYNVYVGGDVDGSEVMGVYDASTVTGFSEEAKQQCYSSTGTLGGMGPGGGFQPPEGFDPSQMGEPPEGFDPSQMGGPPEGFAPSQMGPGGPGGAGGTANGNGTREFYAEDRVNGFIGVTDFTGEETAPSGMGGPGEGGMPGGMDRPGEGGMPGGMDRPGGGENGAPTRPWHFPTLSAGAGMPTRCNT